MRLKQLFLLILCPNLSCAMAPDTGPAPENEERGVRTQSPERPFYARRNGSWPIYELAAANPWRYTGIYERSLPTSAQEKEIPQGESSEK